jgi:hypothetical protein
LSAAEHLRQVQFDLPSVHLKDASATVRIEAEVAVAQKRPVASARERSQPFLPPLVPADQTLLATRQIGAAAEDHVVATSCPTQIHGFERSAVQRPSINGATREASLHEVAQILLLSSYTCCIQVI